MVSKKKKPNDEPFVILKTFIHLIDDKRWMKEIQVEGDYGDSLTYMVRAYQPLKAYPIQGETYPTFETLRTIDYTFTKYMETMENITKNYFYKHIHFEMNWIDGKA